MEQTQDYKIDLEQKFGFLELIDVPKLIELEHGKDQEWSNQILCQVNDSVVRLGILNEGEFHWHKHDKEDEFFFVLQGILIIQLEDREVELGPYQGLNIPKGVLHCPKVKEPVVVIMVERESAKPAGD